jgi:UDP-glucuronate 4-epimerase
MRYLVTGAAGFIGYHVAARLLARGDEVVGIDNFTDYYDVKLKRDRLAQLDGKAGFTFQTLDMAGRDALAALFAAHRPQVAIHLAAQAGVRYSINNPEAYLHSNVAAFLHLLERCRHSGVQHLVYASSSSVYGANTKMPFQVRDVVDHPVSLYAASKKSNELMAHVYSHLFGIPTTGLRFFTVYGPWGRPDMAMFLFTRAILDRRPIEVFNNGEMQRDFTYIDDIVEGVLRVAGRPAAPNPAWNGDDPDPATSRAPYRIYNIGNSRPVPLLRMIEALEAALGTKAEKKLLPMQPGDVPATWADVSDLERDFGYRPATEVEEGVRRFVAWYRSYYRV